MLAVAKDYGVSSSYMARVCTSLKVPRPPCGYWAKVRAGYTPRRPPLPPPRPGDEVAWYRGGALATRPLLGGPPASVSPTPTKGARRERPTYHPLVAGVREFFDVDRVSEFGYLRPTKRLLVDLVVSKPALPRALDVANALLLGLEDHGHRVIIAPYGLYYHRPELVLEGKARQQAGYGQPWHPARPTVLYIGSTAIGLTLYEPSEPLEVQHVGGKYVPVSQVTEALRRKLPSWEWTTTHYPPSGRLALRAYSPDGNISWQKEWSEAKPGEFLHRLQTVRREFSQAVPEIEALLDKARLEAEERHRERQIEKAKRDREERERREKEAYKESREQLLAIVDRWALARRIEDFFQDLERRTAGLEEAERTALSARLQEAREMLGTVDAAQHFSAWRSPAERLRDAGLQV